MAFALLRDESAAAGLRRITMELLDDARVRLAGLRQPDKDIHETRKNVKKIRAVLRLGRAGLGETVYQRDNPYLRDFNRRLARLRESYVHRKLLRSMQASFKGQLKKQDLAVLQRRLSHEHSATIDALVQSPERRQSLEDELAVILTAVSNWPDFGAGDQVLERGLKLTYRRGRDEFAIARQRPGTEEFHDWRKRVKYLWYQLRMLSACWPRALDAQAGALHELSELLGDDHDIAVFHSSILAGDIELEPAQRKALLDGLMDRRRELAREALASGARCYLEPPGAFARRIMGYWRYWIGQ